MTDREYDIAKGVSDHLVEKRYAPSVAEIARMLERSTTTTFKNMIQMREDGLLDWIVGEPRTIHVTELGLKQLRREQRIARAVIGAARASRK